ncbi:uncharacterized protein [Vicugna pacos]|uniref:Uncharacterized protein n=1 Tax=Vicugna pacos TaxID=30538 RepID=A0ABM5CIV1_VICPA
MTGRSSTVCPFRFWKLTRELRSLGSSSISNLHSFPDQRPKPSPTEGGSTPITLIHPQISARLPRIHQPQQASWYTPTFHLESNRVQYGIHSSCWKTCKSISRTRNPLDSKSAFGLGHGVLRPHPVFGNNRPLFGKCPVPRAGRQGSWTRTWSRESRNFLKSTLALRMFLPVSARFNMSHECLASLVSSTAVSRPVISIVAERLSSMCSHLSSIRAASFLASFSWCLP